MAMIATDDVLPHKMFLGDVFDCFDGDPDQPDLSSGVVQTCAGEWRRESGWPLALFLRDTETE